MNRKIIVMVRNVYGVPKAYPENREAKLLASIAGTKTITVETLAKAVQLGFEIEQQTPATDLAYLPLDVHP